MGVGLKFFDLNNFNTYFDRQFNGDLTTGQRQSLDTYITGLNLYLES